MHQIYRPGYRYKKTGIQLSRLVSEEECQPEFFDRPGTSIQLDKIIMRSIADWGFRWVPLSMNSTR